VLVTPSAQVWLFSAQWRWRRTMGTATPDIWHRWMDVVVSVTMAEMRSVSVRAGFRAGGPPMGVQTARPVELDARLVCIGRPWHVATDWPGQQPRRVNDSGPRSILC
jgi:amidase